MSKPAIAALAIVAIAAGGYSAFWFKTAGDVKSSLESSVAMFNEKMKPLVKNGEFLHYDSIETSGFPLSLKLTITKPVITAPVDAIIRLIPAKPNDPMKVPADFSWLDIMSLGKDVTVTSNLIGSEFTVAFDNNFTAKNMVNGQAHPSLTSEAASPLLCHIKTAPSGFLGVKEIHADTDTLVNMFRSADCSTAGITVKAADSGATVFTADKESFSLSHVAANGSRSFSLKADMGDVAYTPASDAIMNDFMQVMAQATGKPADTMPYSFSELGKINGKVDMGYNGPDTSAGFSDSSMKANVDLNALDFSSALVNFGMQMHMSLDTQGAEQNSSLAIHVKANVSDRYDQVLSAQTQKIVADIANPAGKTGRELETAQNMSRVGSPEAITNTVLPHFHPLGDMAFDLDSAIHGPKDQVALMTRGHFILNALNVVTTPYGVKMNGELNGSPNKTPSGKADLTCMNCDAMISDLGDYVIRVTAFVDALHPDKKIVRPTKSLYDGIRVFAHSIALNGNDPAAKDLNFNVVAKDTGEYTISGKPVMDVMQSYMANIAANIPAQPAPAHMPTDNLPSLIQPPHE